MEVGREAVTTCSLTDLPYALRCSLFGLLQPQELLSSAQCCRALRELAHDEFLWETLAKARWPATLLDLTPHTYSTYKSLVLDGNRRNAAESLPLSTACTWRQGTVDSSSFYQCKLLSLDLTGDNDCRLAFDARGELDIRCPTTSTLAVVTLTPEASGAQGQAADRIEIPSGQAWSSTPFEAVHWAMKPKSYKLFAGQRGHYKGILSWPSQELLAALDAPNRSLVFCYACDLGSSGVMSYRRGWPDYTTALLLTTPMHLRFPDAWQAKRVYRRINEQEESLLEESVECEEGRWADRPAWVAARPDWWPVHRPVSCEWKEALGHQLLAEGGMEWMQGWESEGSEVDEHEDEAD